MMKKSILLMPLAAMLAASCSNDDNLANDGKGNGNGGDAYVAVSIQLPTTKGTRAEKNDVAGNVNFNNGIEAEYNVKDVTILIFDSSDNFEQYYSTENGSLSDLSKDSVNQDGNNITQTLSTTVPLRVTNSGEKHIVAVLNNNKKFDFSTLAKLEDLTKMLNTSQNNTNNSSEHFGSYTTTGGDGCFFMTSSPYISGSSLVTYATVTPSTTAQAAKKNLGHIYVERILGKVSLKTPSSDNWGNSDWTYTVPTSVHGSESAYAGASVKFENWILDVTNKSSYLLRNVPESKVTNNGDWSSVANLIGSAQTSSNNMQRIYWAEDPNYDATQAQSNTATNAVNAGLFNTLAADGVASVNGELSVPQYCFENTFDTDNMRKDRTTRVLFKAQFTPKGMKDGDTWFTLGASTTPRSVDDVKALVESAKGITGYSLVDKWEEKLTCTSTALPAEAFKANAGSDAISADSLSAINSAIGALKCYINGECYYVGRIRHFDDAKYTAGNESYDALDLGRYGIVRNNWYQLTVNTVSQPGTPSIPVPDSSIDDDNNYYIDCDINILSWAVREHGFDF